jgi:hypothetical protein
LHFSNHRTAENCQRDNNHDRHQQGIHGYLINAC